MASASIEIPTDVLESARLSPDQLELELALSLYIQCRLSVGKARELAGSILENTDRRVCGARELRVMYRH